MRKFMMILQLLILMYLFELCRNSWADTNISTKAVIKQGKIDPADIEVITNLELLQDWDIVGPQGPDMKKLDVLNTLSVKGVSHAK